MEREGVNQETRNRILVTLYAFAYECMSESLVSDKEYDDLARKIDLSAHTGRPDLDAWFRENFDPNTGCWIWAHPELDRVKAFYVRFRSLKK